MTRSDPGTAARDRLLSTRRESLAAVLDAADDVAASWPRLPDGRPATGDRAAVVPPLRTALEETGVLSELPAVLTDAVDAAGFALPAVPVPAPPYVAVTSTGPVLRGTVDDGRLVVAVECFEVVRAGDSLGDDRVVAEDDATRSRGVRYARPERGAGDRVADALSVRFERSD